MTESLIRPRPRRWGWLIPTCLVAVVWSLVSTAGAPANMPADAEGYRTSYLLGSIAGSIALVFAVMLGVHAIVFLRKSGQELVGRHALFILGAAVTGALPAIIMTILLATSGPDMAKLDALNQQLEARAAAKAQEFDQRSWALGGGDVLAAETLMSTNGLRQARTNIAAQRELYREREAFVQGHMADVRAEIENADVSAFAKWRALAAFDRDQDHVLAQSALIMQKNREILDEWEAALDLLAIRPRRWTAQNGDFSFYTDADFATFDAHMNRVETLEAEANALAAGLRVPDQSPTRREERYTARLTA